MTTLDVRRATDRFSTQWGWLDSHHSFSFGHHYDPTNTGFGLLLVSNDDVVAAGTGLDTHPHRDMEIVTWVLDGALVHQDSEGNTGVIYPGLAQRMSAGTGILHSEKNDDWRITGGDEHDKDVHFIQMWVVPDTGALAPGYAQLDINEQLDGGGLVTVASGRPGHDAAIRIQQKHAALHAARPSAGSSVEIPAAPFVHLYVAKGQVDLEGAGALEVGDSVRISDAEAMRVTASTDAEVLVWEMHAALR